MGNQVTVTIRGVQYPLCLTVAAFEQISEKCGGWENLQQFLLGGDNFARAVGNTAYTLGVLIQEGEENRQMEARFSGEKTAPVVVPGPECFIHFRPAEVIQYREAVLQAIAASMQQEVETEPPKNAEGAEPR